MPRLTLEEAAAAAGVSTRRLRQLCQEGRVRGARKFGPILTVQADKDGRITIKPGTRGPESTIPST